MRMLEPVHGMPASDRGENIDCAASYATWPNSLTVWFAHGEFRRLVGEFGELDHANRESAQGGVAPGRARLPGFDSPNAGAQVTDPWVGTTCIAR